MIMPTKEARANTSELWTSYASGSFHGGSGTETDPYQISTPEELAYLAKFVNEGGVTSGKYYKLTTSLDLGTHQWVSIGSTIVDDSYYFCGNFDGASNTISNLNVGTESNNKYDLNAGLFGDTMGGTIKNVGVGVNIFSTCGRGGSIGALIDFSNSTEIINCFSTGNLSVGAVQYGGGLVGIISGGNIIDSYSTVNVTATSAGTLGGLTAGAFSCKILNAFSTGNVASNNYNSAGGFIARVDSSEIKNCLDYKPWAITAAMNNGYPVHVEKKSGANITGVSIDDRGNTISGITAAMEFSTDGVIWTKYNDVAPNLPALTGNLALQLRYAETATHKNGIAAKFEFKKPIPEVSNISGNVVDKNEENIQAINVKVTTESNGTKTLELKAKDILVLKTLNGALSTMLSDSSKLGFSSNSDAVISISTEGIINIKNLAKGTNSKIALTYDLGYGKKLL